MIKKVKALIRLLDSKLKQILKQDINKQVLIIIKDPYTWED